MPEEMQKKNKKSEQPSTAPCVSAHGTYTWVNFKPEMFSDPIFLPIDFSLASGFEGCGVQIAAL